MQTDALVEWTQRVPDDTQLIAFNREYVNDRRWSFFQSAVEAQVQHARRLRFLDVGGGAGDFAVRVRTAYPQWNVHVLDISDFLLSHAKSKGLAVMKLSILDNIPERWVNAFDIVSVNYVLHHLVGSSHAQTTANVMRALSNLRRLVASTGMVSVFENNYVGHLFHDSCGRLIYELTSNRVIAQLARRLGANSAGVGVRFRSAIAWQQMFQSAGFMVRSVRFDRDFEFDIGRIKKILLNAKEAHACHFCLTP